jgi:hypothetical protein
MSSSPTLQPQRGAGGKSSLDELAVVELVVDKLADEIAVDAHREAPVEAEAKFCVEIAVDVWSSTDSESTGISAKF